ncbi:hypothetical protein [Jhaorihella thermophila]|uniref:hypothetical protein n=1 Tax=Jhaorihella thermophila TaxID=488547 RepID=UPI00361F2FEB
MSTWKRQAVEAWPMCLPVAASREGPTEAEVKELHAKIGRLAVENDVAGLSDEPDQKKSMIRRDHPDLSISQQCRLLKLSRSSSIIPPVGVDAATLALMRAIDRVFTKYPFSGRARSRALSAGRDGIVAGVTVSGG